MATVVFDREGSSGNVFYILGMAFSSMLREGRREEAKAMSSRVQSADNYDSALKIIGEYVNLMEVRK